MRSAIALFISPFALAAACGARVEQPIDVDTGATSSANSATASQEQDSGPPDMVGGGPVHCAPLAAPFPTATCAPGSACDVEGDVIACKPHTGPVNCGRVQCEGRCTCGGLSYGSFCTCK